MYVNIHLYYKIMFVNIFFALITISSSVMIYFFKGCFDVIML